MDRRRLRTTLLLIAALGLARRAPCLPATGPTGPSIGPSIGPTAMTARAAQATAADPHADRTATDAAEAIRSALAAGDRERARTLLSAAVAALQDPPPGSEDERIAALQELDRLADELGGGEPSLALREAILALRLRVLPADHADVSAAREDLARRLYVLGDLAGASALFEEVLAVRSRLLPAEDPDLLAARQNVALTRKALGDLEGARALEEDLLAIRARLLPADHPDLLVTMQGLAVTRYMVGDVDGSLELFEGVHEARGRTLPAEHADVLAAKQNLAIVRKAVGDIEGALALEEEVLAVRTRLLPPDHLDLLAAKGNLATTRSSVGDLEGALALEEEVLAGRARALPADHPDLLGAKQSLAVTRTRLGDLAGGRALEEEVLAARARLLPADHPLLLAARQNLATTRYRLGDVEGANELFEQVLATRSRLLPPDHPDLLGAKQNLATTCRELGDLVGAAELDEEVLASRARLLAADHPEVLAAKQNLALTRKALGELSGARELLEEVLEARARLLPVDHPDTIDTRQNLAVTLLALGDAAGALALEEAVLAARTRLLPTDHPDLRATRQCVARMRAAVGDDDGAREMTIALLGDLRRRSRALRLEAPRFARESARWDLRLFFACLASGDPSSEAGLAAELFATLETLRDASVAGSSVALAVAARPELAAARRDLVRTRTDLDALVAAGPAADEEPEQWRRRLVRLAEERDGLERELRLELAGTAVHVDDVDAAGVAAALAPDGAAVSYLRYPRPSAPDPETGLAPAPIDSLLAFVVSPDARVARVELGPVAPIEAAVLDWRTALGKPVVARGAPVRAAANGATALDELGERLRALVLDPVLARAPDARELHVVLDDLLHLVPLDALPVEDGLLGDEVALRVESSFGRLVHPRADGGAGSGLLLAGGIDYDADPEPSVPGASGERGHRARRPGGAFDRLPGAGDEVEAIGGLYEESFGSEPVLLAGGAASKAAFADLTSSVRWLHVATHGWFAPEALRSQADEAESLRDDELLRRAERTVRGFAPETLCGLAFAGANLGRDELGRVPGILTAEELSSLDLTGCELAVLSACETSVGVRRAGQGMQSLQAALHGAGVRTAITSLWKVDDAATGRLMALFYENLWKRGLGKSEALWRAKRTLRAEGRPARDWAGWVLSGDPR